MLFPFFGNKKDGESKNFRLDYISTKIYHHEVTCQIPITIITDSLDDELVEGQEALERDAEILGAQHAVTARREDSRQGDIVMLNIYSYKSN